MILVIDQLHMPVLIIKLTSAVRHFGLPDKIVGLIVLLQLTMRNNVEQHSDINRVFREEDVGL